MAVKFISQGFNQSSASYCPAVDLVCDFLSDPRITKFEAFVAFANSNGVNSLKPELESFIKRGGIVNIYLGVDLQGTSKEALEMLMSLGIQVSIVHSRNDVTYHPKVYVFDGTIFCASIIGSSNLTGNGLDKNIEASVLIDADGDSLSDSKAIIKSIHTHFKPLIDNTSDIVQILTPDLLRILIENRTVITEKESHELTNRRNESLATTANARGRLKELFGQAQTSRSPHSAIRHTRRSTANSKPTIVAEEINNTETDPTIVDRVFAFSEGSMWICTGKMTGGSRNILDLSMRGKRDAAVYPGSITFFINNPNDKATQHEVSIEYNGKCYNGNTIKYTDRNQNWRFQMKGITEDGEKLTSIGTPRLGWSGFPHSILVFEKTDNDNVFKMTILDESELENLKAASSSWTMGGNGNGRMYGWL